MTFGKNCIETDESGDKILKKRCLKCGKLKSINQFYERPRKKFGSEANCKDCCRRKKAENYQKNPEIMKKRQKEYTKAKPITVRANYLKNKFGITIEEYEKMLKKQNGACAICKKPETTICKGTLRRLSVDHCHKTGRIRGLLCNRCNTSLGRINEDIDILKASIVYLMRT